MKYLALLTALAIAGCHRSPVPSQTDSGAPPAPVTVVDASAPIDAGDPNACSDSSCPMPQRILIVGDSEAGYISRCVSNKSCIDPIRHPWERLDVDYKGGTTVQQWSAGGMFHAALGRHAQPDTVIIFLGTNNYLYKTAPDASSILSEVKQKDIKCVWVGPTSVQGKSWIVNDLLKQEVQNTCTYVDTESLNIPLEDGVHPTPDGVVKWLKAIWQAKQ